MNARSFSLQAAKEIRENLKVIGRITGEIPLAPVVAATAETGGLHVQVVYESKPVEPARSVIELLALICDTQFYRIGQRFAKKLD